LPIEKDQNASRIDGELIVGDRARARAVRGAAPRPRPVAVRLRAFVGNPAVDVAAPLHLAVVKLAISSVPDLLKGWECRRSVSSRCMDASRCHAWERDAQTLAGMSANAHSVCTPHLRRCTGQDRRVGSYRLHQSTHRPRIRLVSDRPRYSSPTQQRGRRTFPARRTLACCCRRSRTRREGPIGAPCRRQRHRRPASTSSTADLYAHLKGL
jgi:hypothetical protein